MVVSPDKPSLDVTLNKEICDGQKQIVLMRELGNNQAALTLLYQTEHELGKSRDSDVQRTKSGNIIKTGAIEYDFSLTAFQAVNDPAIRMINNCFENNKKIELWIINLQHKHPSSDKYAAEYFQAYITDVTSTANTEDYMELELEFGVEMQGQEGWATVTMEQMADAQYKFADTVTEV